MQEHTPHSFLYLNTDLGHAESDVYKQGHALHSLLHLHTDLGRAQTDVS